MSFNWIDKIWQTFETSWIKSKCQEATTTKNVFHFIDVVDELPNYLLKFYQNRNLNKRQNTEIE